MGRKAAIEAPARRSRFRIVSGALSVAAVFVCLPVALALLTVESDARFRPRKNVQAETPPVRRDVSWPIEIPDAQYAPLGWSDVAGWSDDDPSLALKAFRVSCAPILAQRSPPTDSKALGTSLREPCKEAKLIDAGDSKATRDFFESHFVPLRISRLTDEAGFVTGYYEPIVDGSRTQTDAFPVPLYRRPSNLFVKGFSQASASLPNKGQVFRKIGRRKLVPYYDRGAIEDGAIAGRGLEVVWLHNQTDLLFIQIQGSARIRLEDGSMVRINYDAHNGYPYTPVGRVLIERNIVPKADMSMQRIREYMEQNPDAANELRRQNRSYVFFREVALSEKDEAVGGQGVQLTAGRSIAVDKALHVYGTPFFIEADLPIESDKSNTPFRRLMIAQDTGSAIVGPARADIYFGAGKEAGQMAGRIKNAARFTLLLPKALDPIASGKTMPLPAERPSALIAKLFPPTDPVKDQPKEEKKDDKKEKPDAVPVATAPVTAPVVPLPEPRPKEAPARLEAKAETATPTVKPAKTGRSRSGRRVHTRQ